MFSLNYKKNRIFGLDIFRAVAILTVLVGHGMGLLKQVFPQAMHIVLPNGVEMFFVLSGFLIGQIIFKNTAAGEFKTGKDLLRFLKFRWFRTLPNYYLIVFINVVLAYWQINNQNVQFYSWKFLFFLQNFAGSFKGFFPESWSLSVEEWFYLLFPAALILAFVIFKRKNVKWLSLIIIAFFIALPLVFKFQTVATNLFTERITWIEEIRKVVVFRLDSIIVGVFLAWCKHFYSRQFFAWRYHLLFIGLVLNILNRTVFANFDTVYFQAFYLLVNGFAMAMLLPFFDNVKSGTGIIYRTITYISVISYAIYVVHFSIVLSMFLRWVDLSTLQNAMLAYTGFWFFSIILAHVLYKYWEKPMTDLREKF